MTMTHSDEVTNKGQNPGPTDMSDGAPWGSAQAKKAPETLWKRQCAESCGELTQQACALTNSSEFKYKGVLTDTPE